MTLFQLRAEPGDYVGQYFIGERQTGKTMHLGPLQGNGSFFLTAGNYFLFFSHGASIYFGVTGQGMIDPQGSCGLIGDGPVIRLRTNEVTIDPGAYNGAFSIVGVDDISAPGTRSFRAAVGVVGTGNHPDEGYSIRIAHGNGFRFDLDCGGTLGLSDFHVGAATTVGSRLTFCTVGIEITPLNYHRAWGVTGVERTLANGARVVRLIRHVENYILQLDRTTLNGRFSLTKTGEPERELIEIVGEGELFRFQLRLVPGI